VACRKMSVKTFAHPEVKKLIDQHFVLVELNVDHAKEAAGWFAGKAIPDT
jgi:thioredoxin-related protein